MARSAFLATFLLQFNSLFGITVMWDRYVRRRQKLWEPLVILLALFSVTPMLAGLFFLYQGLYLAFDQIGQGYLVLTLAVVAGQVLTLFFGLFYLLSAFFYSRDIPFLMSLPLSPWQVLGAKFALVVVSEYLTVAPVVLPALLAYGLAAGDFGFLPAAVGVYLLLPVLPLTLGSLLVLGLVRFSGFFRRPEAVRGLGLILTIVLILGFQYTVGPAIQGDPEAFGSRIMAGSVDLLPLVGRYFPPSIWATGWLAGLGPAAGWGQGLLFVGATAAGLVLLGWVAGRVYYPGLLAGTGVAYGAGKAATRKARAGSRAALTPGVALAKVQTPLAALFNREHLIFLRTTMWVLNAVAGMLIIPVAIAVPIFLEDRNEMGFLVELLRSGEWTPWVTLGGVALVQFIASGAGLAATAVSREGRRFWLSLALPVPARLQVLAKLLHAEAFTLVTTLLVGAMLFFVAGPQGFDLLPYLLLSLLISWVANEAGLAIDLLRPLLDWDEPQKALKGNLNGLFGMLAAFFFLAFLAGLTALVTWLAPKALYWVLGAFVAALALAGQEAVSRLAERRYPQLG